MDTAPAKPTATPAALSGVNRSSGVIRCAARTVNSGVVAFRMEARPLAMWCWPHTISTKGTTLLSSPMPKKAAQMRPSVGICCPSRRSTPSSVTAATATRSQTRVKEGSSRTATALKKNEPPHSTARASSMAHSRPPIAGGAMALLWFTCASPDLKGNLWHVSSVVPSRFLLRYPENACEQNAVSMAEAPSAKRTVGGRLAGRPTTLCRHPSYRPRCLKAAPCWAGRAKTG